MAPPFPNNRVRRYTQRFLEEDSTRGTPWTRLVSWKSRARQHPQHNQPQASRVGFWRDSQGPKSCDVEMASSDADSSFHVDARQDLFHIMVANLKPDAVLTTCWRWYLSYLDSQIKELWSVHLGPVIKDLPPTWRAGSSADWAQIYKVICVIASTISKGTADAPGVEISLDNILDELSTADLLANPITIGYVRQMVWALAGCITMLFDPKASHTNPTLLQLRRPASTHIARGRHRGTVITNFSQPIATAQEPFYQMLMLFGTLLPEVRRNDLAGPCIHTCCASANASHFYPNHVSFYVLKKLAKLRIEWVNTLNLHLQLDERKRILRLYRFPAFCRLLYAEGPISSATSDNQLNATKSFLCQLFNHYKASRMQGQPQERDSLTFYDFLRDMILSYRLLFGMDSKSRHIFRQEIRDHAPSTSRKSLVNRSNNQTNNDSNTLQRDTVHDGPFSGQRMYDVDPLLWDLCATDPNTNPELKNLLQLLDGEEKSSRYAFEDFPFLGGRLQQLQSFIEGHKATTWSSLWHDRTDARNWWIVWTAIAVLLIAGGTFVLQLMQSIFQGFSNWP